MLVCFVGKDMTAPENKKKKLFQGVCYNLVQGNILSADRKTILLLLGDSRGGTAIYFTDYRPVKMKGILPCCSINLPVRITQAKGRMDYSSTTRAIKL